MFSAKIIHSQSGYKPFIDGLRAIAILAVVAYHIGFKQVPGGFVGVDIFFVISGYLICTHMISLLSNGTFSFGEFWARRALRIFPAYLLVIGVSLIAAPFVLVTHGEFIEIGREAAYSAVMLANHYFLGQQGYFDGAADTKPLLHLWSLAVEEQFYLAAPVILFLLYKLGRRFGLISGQVAIGIVVTVLFALSLYGCIRFSNAAGKNYAFFLTVFRVWEFMFGGAIAFAVPFAQRLPRLILNLLALCGLWLVASSIMYFSGSNLYPSNKAIIPVLGAALIILCGIAQPKIVVARALAFKPMVMVGFVSYAWYLWHWPLLTFGRIFNFGQRHLPFDLVMALIALLLAWLTYWFIDRSILRWRKGRAEKLQWKHACAMIMACVPIGMVGVFVVSVFAPYIERSFTEAQIPKTPDTSGVCNLHFVTDGTQCADMAKGYKLGLLIGDSHTDAFYPLAQAKAMENGAFLATMGSGGCASFLTEQVHIADINMANNCHGGRENAKRILEKKEIQPAFAILFSRWPLYLTSDYYLQTA